jgi:hypothetical protein
MSEEKPTPNFAESENAELPLDYELYHYSLDKDGNWSRKMVSNWGHKEIIAGQTWIIVQERLNAAKERVLKGETSPIDYYMVKCIMDVKLCSEFTGFSKHKVKQHLKPKVFKKLSGEILQRYATAFEISVEEFTGLEEKLKQETKKEE